MRLSERPLERRERENDPVGPSREKEIEKREREKRERKEREKKEREKRERKERERLHY